MTDHDTRPPVGVDRRGRLVLALLLGDGFLPPWFADDLVRRVDDEDLGDLDRVVSTERQERERRRARELEHELEEVRDG